MTNPPNQGVELLAVTQADREAAADYLDTQGGYGIDAHIIRTGQADFKDIAQAFARHRLSSTPTPASSGALVEVAKAVLEHRVGEQPTRGYLRDNDASRTALTQLAQALSSASTDTGAREGENCSDCGGTGDNPTPIKWPGRYCPTCEGTGKAPNTDTPTDECRRGGWQSIESAPKDGTLVWAFWPEATAEDQQVVARWSDTVEGPRWVDHADAMDWCQPTHWQPLPTSPEPLGTAKERGE